jgi:hypothetical protein
LRIATNRPRRPGKLATPRDRDRVRALQTCCAMTALARGLAVAGTAVACGGGEPGNYDYAGSRGAALYTTMCAVCHGEAGEGGLGPALIDSPRGSDDLAAIIAARMPANDPGRCTGDCATDLADFIVHGLTSEALRCDRDGRVIPAPRRLRLLTRREYRATVRDLFGDAAPAMSCATPTECAFRDTCDGGLCASSPCDTHTFVYDPGARVAATVHVAGTFNGWPSTIAAGGLPLAYSAATGVWTGTFALGEGTHHYKLVVDENDWIEDPRAPAFVPDGFGGRNAVLALSCEGGAGDPAHAIPIENRPAGFAFDTDADVAVASTSHVDAYLAAARSLSDDLARRRDQVHPCAWGDDRDGCAAGLVRDLGRRVFRRPLAGDEIAAYVALVAAAPDAERGVATAVHAMLVSPHFLYRSEIGEPIAGGRFRLTGFEVATALAYTFWGTTPDATLLDAAAAGELDDAAGIERHARRLVGDPRARDQIGDFALQWAAGEAVLTADKRADLFPGFDAATRAALVDETRAFAAHAIFDGSGRWDELITADYTVVDATAAAFYDLAPPPVGDGVIAYDGRRAGILGHASMLAGTAHSDQTSPIRRGLFVRRHLLCQDLPPPPPFAGGVPDVDPSATTRDRFAQHTADPVCAGCHRYIDGVGFGFEHFDPVGRWRTHDAGTAIDATGDLIDVEGLGTGTSARYASVPELASLVAGSGAGRRCFVKQYYRFSRGQRDDLANRCARSWLDDRMVAAGGDVREMMVQSVLAPDFAVRR